MFSKIFIAMTSRGSRGAVASEYAVLLALIAVALVTAIGVLEGAIGGAMNGAANVINN